MDQTLSQIAEELSDKQVMEQLVEDWENSFRSKKRKASTQKPTKVAKAGKGK